jgi:hypothetical protein
VRLCSEVARECGSTAISRRSCCKALDALSKYRSATYHTTVLGLARARWSRAAHHGMFSSCQTRRRSDRTGTNREGISKRILRFGTNRCQKSSAHSTSASKDGFYCQDDQSPCNFVSILNTTADGSNGRNRVRADSMFERLPDELQENILKRACTPFQLVYFDDDEHFDVCLSTYLELLQTSRAV